MAYLNQFRSAKCFLQKISRLGNVTAGKQIIEYLFSVPPAEELETHCTEHLFQNRFLNTDQQFPTDKKRFLKMRHASAFVGL
jgi:hypothetical protein